MDAEKLFTYAVTKLLKQQLDNVSAGLNDVDQFLHGVQKHCKDVEHKELLAVLCKDDMTETVKSALSYVDSADHFFGCEQNTSTIAKIKNGFKINDLKPLNMFLCFQDRRFQIVGEAYRKVIEDCKRAQDTFRGAAVECRKRQVDSCKMKHTAQVNGTATTIGIGCGGIAISIGVGIFTGGIGFLLCLPIAAATTGASACITKAVVDQCAATENSYGSLYLQFNHWAKNTTKLCDSLSIVQQHIESREQGYSMFKYQTNGNPKDAFDKFLQATPARNPNYMKETNKIKQLADE